MRAVAWRQRDGGSTAVRRRHCGGGSVATAVRRQQYGDGSTAAARVCKPAFVSHEAIRVEVKIPQTQGPMYLFGREVTGASYVYQCISGQADL